MNIFRTSPTEGSGSISLSSFSCGGSWSPESSTQTDVASTQGMVDGPKLDVTTYLPTIATKNQSDSMQNIKPSPRSSGVLMERLLDYESRGWVEPHDFRQYRHLLQKYPSSQFYIRQIERELNQIAANKGSVASPVSSITEKPPSILNRNRAHGSGNRVSWEDLPRDMGQEVSLATDEDIDEIPTDESEEELVVLEPADLWNGSAQFSEKQLQELFVEMCFFARLGFIQPPCCLQCTYKESIRKRKASPRCTRWIVWRKNAQTLLHPNRLDGNIVILQCHAARDLLDGNTVQGRVWNSELKQIVNV